MQVSVQIPPLSGSLLWFLLAGLFYKLPQHPILTPIRNLGYIIQLHIYLSVSLVRLLALCQACLFGSPLYLHPQHDTWYVHGLNESTRLRKDGSE